jgi:hypothetical protein
MSVSAAKCLKIIILIFVLACNSSAAKEVVSVDRDFRVSRDFNPIILSKADREVARVYFDGFKRAPSKDVDILNQIATDTLTSKVILAPAKDHANYIVQMIMSEIPNYAIKNTEGKAARGFILIAICRLPLSSSPKDCENLTYHYFRDYESAVLLRIVLSRWMRSVFP